MLFQGPEALWFVTIQAVGLSESEMLEARQSVNLIYCNY